MSNKENGSTPGSGGGGSSTNQTNASGASSEAHQYVGPYRLEKTLGKGQTGKNPISSIDLKIKITKQCFEIQFKTCFQLIFKQSYLSVD